MHRRHALMMIAATAAFPVHALERIAGPWDTFGSGGDPDYRRYDAVLANGWRMGGDGVARFDYADADAGEVDAVVRGLASVDPTTLSRDAAFAYWANLYNALTLEVVVDAMPVTSIRRIGGSLFAPGPWRDKRVRVAGIDLSLDDIEHGILRPIWRDPRVHYAVNCASIGCPNLRATAWRASSLDADLTAAARAYVNHPRGARIAGGRLTVSSIYEWFQEDFGNSDAGVIAHLREYASPEFAAQLASVRTIAADTYDWDLNAA